MEQIELSVQESLAYAQETAYWDGIVAGVQLAAGHAKQLMLKGLKESRKHAPQAITESVAGRQPVDHSQDAYQRQSACDCHKFSNQVCDICQGVSNPVANDNAADPKDPNHLYRLSQNEGVNKVVNGKAAEHI